MFSSVTDTTRIWKSGFSGNGKTAVPAAWRMPRKRTSHFRVPRKKTRLSAQPLIWKWLFIFMQIKLIFTRKVVHLASFWKVKLRLHWPWGVWGREKEKSCLPVLSPFSHSFSKTGQWSLRRRLQPAKTLLSHKFISLWLLSATLFK